MDAMDATAATETTGTGDDAPGVVEEARYTGWVYWADVGPREGFFASPDALREWCLWCTADRTPPAEVQACAAQALGLDAVELIEDACAQQDLHEDAKDLVDPGGYDALQKLLDGWLAQHASRVATWFPVEGRRVRLDPAKWEAARAEHARRTADGPPPPPPAPSAVVAAEAEPPSLEQIAARYAERRTRDPLGFEADEYLSRLDFARARPFLKPEVTEAEWEQARAPRYRAALLARMREYMPFARDKAEGERANSASRSVGHYVAWAWLAGDARFSREIERLAREQYAPYGLPVLRAICAHYGWPWDADPLTAG